MSTNPKPRVERANCLERVVFSVPADEEGRTLFPTLFDLMCPRYHGMTCTRQGARFTIKVDGGAYRVSIECPTEGLQTSFFVESLDNFPLFCENYLTQGAPHWGLTWAQQKKNQPTIDEIVK